MPEWTLGFKDYAAAHNLKGPITGLSYDNFGNAWQYNPNGLLFWHKAKNAIHFFEKSPN